MANKVDVFTEELSKVFTILQQQYVMIKYMKTLITSGELDETEISKLKEQVTLINSKINTINSNINNIENALARHTDEIDNNIATINALNNVMPTDINVDSNGNLILEHDGQEITGQKKQVAVYTKSQINTLLNSAGLKTFTLKNKDDYNYNSGINSNKITVTTTDINILNDCVEYVRDNGACILEFDYINRETTYDSPIRILMLYALNGGYGHIVFHGTTGNCEVNGSAIRSTTAQPTENEIIINVLANKSQIKDYKVYRHQLQCITDDNSQVFCVIMSSNNLKINSIQDLTNVTKARQGYEEICHILNDPNVGSIALLKYNGTIWQVVRYAEDIFTYNITSITDTVTTI